MRYVSDPRYRPRNYDEAVVVACEGLAERQPERREQLRAAAARMLARKAARAACECPDCARSGRQLAQDAS